MARKAIRETGPHTGPIDPWDMARKLKCSVEERPGTEDDEHRTIEGFQTIYGFSIPEERRIVLVVWPDESQAVKRFTLAHEIGHVQLHPHSNPFAIEGEYTEEPLPIPRDASVGCGKKMPKPGEYISLYNDCEGYPFLLALFRGGRGLPRNDGFRTRKALNRVQEWEADEFARELMMPLASLKKVGPNALDPDRVAARFGAPRGEAYRQIRTHLSRLLRGL